MSAGKLDLTIEQGVTFNKLLILKDSSEYPIDITNDTFRGMVRTSFGSLAVVATFIFEMPVGYGVIGSVRWTLPATVTSAIKAGPVYVYDVERVETSGTVTRILQGKIKVSPEVTK